MSDQERELGPVATPPSHQAEIASVYISALSGDELVTSEGGDERELQFLMGRIEARLGEAEKRIDRVLARLGVE